MSQWFLFLSLALIKWGKTALCFTFMCFNFVSNFPTTHPSEFQMINENLALSEVIPLKVHIMEIKTKTYSM